MAILDSTSTNAEVRAAYFDNCGYFEDSDTAMARRFVTACIAMQSRGITSIAHGDERIDLSPKDLRELQKRAEQFAASRLSVDDGGSGTTHVDLREFRI
jgi:hypothetical protein